MRRADGWANIVAMVSAVTALTACGGSGGSASVPAPPPPAPAPAPTLALTSAARNGQAVEGGAAVAIVLSGVTAASGDVTWRLSPSIGTLAQTSAAGAVYMPPAVGSLAVPTTVTITATPTTGSGAALQFTITLLPFGVTAETPAVGDHVGVSVQPAIQFTRTLAAALPASAVSLASPVAAVPVDVAASGATLTLSPKTPLVWGGHYTVSLTSDIVSTVGQALVPASFSFDVAAPGWTTAAQVATSTFTAGAPVVAFDQTGHAFGVWQQDTDGTGTWNIQAARFDLASRTWSAPVALHPVAQAQAVASVATDQAGDAIATWSENVGNFVYNIQAARFDAAQGSWGPATPIQTVAGETGQAPQVVLDAAGNGTVVWQQYTGHGVSLAVYAARFDAATSAWMPATQLDPGNGAGNPQVALDAAGNGVAVWEQARAGAVAQIAAARWSQSADAWGAPQVVQTSPLRGSNPQLAVAADGSTTVVWTQAEANGTLTIQAVRAANATATWGAPQALSPATGVSGGNWPQAKADPGGNVIVLWQQYQAVGAYSVDAVRYDATSDLWGSTAHVESLAPAVDINPYGGLPTLVVDAAGNATAAWSHHDPAGGIDNALLARFDSHLGTWRLVSSPSGSASAGGILMGVDAQGDVLAGWGVRDIHGFGTPWWALLTGA